MRVVNTLPWFTDDRFRPLFPIRSTTSKNHIISAGIFLGVTGSPKGPKLADSRRPIPLNGIA